MPWRNVCPDVFNHIIACLYLYGCPCDVNTDCVQSVSDQHILSLSFRLFQSVGVCPAVALCQYLSCCSSVSVPVLLLQCQLYSILLLQCVSILSCCSTPFFIRFKTPNILFKTRNIHFKTCSIRFKTYNIHFNLSKIRINLSKVRF